MATGEHDTTAVKVTGTRRGIALITVVSAVAVVLMMLAAFLQTHSNHLAMSARGSEQQRCQDAALSLAEFCRFRLEEDRTWPGKLTGEPSDYAPRTYRDAEGAPIFVIREVPPESVEEDRALAALEGRRFLTGELVGTEVQFRISVVNNLASEIEDSVHSVGPKCVRLRIQALQGRATESVEVVLRKAAFFNSTVAASGDIEIKGDAVVFESTDPIRNQIRSLSNIKLPDIEDLVFRPESSSQRAEKGTVWAYGEIFLDDDPSPTKLSQAAVDTGGEFIPGARTNYSVPRLEKEDVETTLEEPPELDPAVYIFGQDEVEFRDTSGTLHTKTIQTLRQYSPGNESPRDDVLVGFHFVAGALEPEDESYTPDPDTVRLSGGADDDPGGTPHEEATFSLENGPEFEFPATVRLPADEEFVVRGDFAIWTTDPYNLPTLEFELPEVIPDPENPPRGYLEVERDLSLAGYIVNGGKLIARRDVKLTPKDVEVSSKEEEDLAVFAGNDVSIAPLFTRNPNGGLDAPRKFVFRGLIYAQNNFAFTSSVSKGDETVHYERRLEVEGALVAREGEVKVQGNETVYLRYNPDFLDDLIERNFENTNSQLEEISWRPL